MYISTLKKVLPYLFQTNQSTLIWGRHGIGKSQAVSQLANELGYAFFDCRLGNMEVGDLIGLADFETDAKGVKVSTKFMMPDWLKNIIDYCNDNPNSGAIIFLDEINRARRDVLQAVFQLVLDKKIHTVSLPKNCFVVAASNPNTEDYIVTDISDQALMDRFCHIKLTPSVDEWLDFAEKSGVSQEMITFITSQKSLLEGKSEDFTIEVKPSRRSWVAVDKLFKAGMPLDLLQEVAYGLVGQPATIAYMEELKNTDKPLPAEEIIKNYHLKRVHEKIKDYSNAETGGRSDLIKHTNKELVNIIKQYHDDNKKFTSKEAGNILNYLLDIPADIMFDTMRTIYPLRCIREYIDTNEEIKERIGVTKAKTKTGK